MIIQYEYIGMIIQYEYKAMTHKKAKITKIYILPTGTASQR